MRAWIFLGTLVGVIIFFNAPTDQLVLWAAPNATSIVTPFYAMIRNYTDELLTAVLIGVFLELAARSHTVEVTKEQFNALREMLSTFSSDSRAIGFTLGQAHADPTAVQLVDSVQPSGLTLRNADISIRIAHEAGAAQATYLYEITMDCTEPEVVVAICEDDEFEVELMHHSRVAEIHFTEFPTDGTRDAFLENIRSKMVVSTKSVGQNGVETYLPCKSSIAPADAIRRLGLPEHDKLAFVLVKLPESARSRVRVSFPPNVFPITNYKYWWWFADRPMHVRSIDVDLTSASTEHFKDLRIRSNIRGRKVESAPFAKNRRCHIEIDKWLAYGQGIIFRW